jgi:phosphoglycolate phosphatase
VRRRFTLLLFDVDGTLMHAGEAGRRAFTRVLERAGASRRVVDNIRFAGMTDRAIMRAALEGSGLAADPAAVKRFLDEYVELLGHELAGSGVRHCRLCPGVVELLDRLQAIADLGLGLGTGNVEAGARLKLAAVGLDGRFAFGGFGSDHEDRTELVRLAIRRGLDRFEAKREETRVVVIGDTPRDVAAARGAGVDCLGVATGSFDVASLLEAGASRAVEDLTAPQAMTWLKAGG